MNKTLPAVRRPELDALRILACFMVVMTHVSVNDWWGLPFSSWVWRSYNLYSSAVRGAVPLFLMISGALFLSRPEPIPLSLLFKKYIARLAALYVLWWFLYAVDAQGIGALTSPSGWLAVLQTGPKSHLWFLPRMIAAYALLPLLWSFVRWQDGKYVRYVCLAALLLLFLPRTLNVLPLWQPARSVLSTIELPLGSFPVYLLLGYYLTTVNIRRFRSWQLLAAYCAVVLLTAVLCAYRSVHGEGGPDTQLLDMTMLPSYFEATLLFVLFQKLSGSTLLHRWSSALHRISECTLGVYLLHIFVLSHVFQWFGITTRSFHALFSVPVFSLGIFLLCLPASALLRKIPKLGKWII